MSPQQTVDLVRTVFDGFNAGDVGRVAAICADDVVLEGIPAGLTLRGPEGMRIHYDGATVMRQLGLMPEPGA